MADERRSPALIATLVAIPVVVVVLFIAVAATRTGGDDRSLPLADASATPSPECTRLLAALPQTFDGYGKRSEDGGAAGRCSGRPRATFSAGCWQPPARGRGRKRYTRRSTPA